jgi:hypothetical protein
MNDEELKHLWRRQTLEEPPALDSRAQIEAMQIKMTKFRRGLDGAYLIELAVRALVIIIFGVYLIKIAFPVTRIGAVLVIAGELFVSW